MPAWGSSVLAATPIWQNTCQATCAMMPMPSSRAEEIRCVEGDGNALHNEGTEQHDQCDGADKAQFLAHDGKDKVVFGVGQPLVLLQTPLPMPTPNRPPVEMAQTLWRVCHRRTGGIGGGQPPQTPPRRSDA